MSRPAKNQQGRVVWIINHYAAHLERDGRATRHQHLAAGLAGYGWHATVIAASTQHPSGRQTFPRARLRQTVHEQSHSFLFLRGVAYTGSGIRRVLDIGLFTLLLLLPGSLRGLPKPDVVIGGSFHPLAAWAAARIARRHGARFVFEPRDLWPATLTAFGRTGEKSIIVRFLKRLEHSIVSSSDLVLSPLSGVGRYYDERGYRVPFLWISNGVEPGGQSSRDVEAVETVSSSANTVESCTASAPFVITYLGSMGPLNALDEVLEAFDRAVARSPQLDLRLRLVGSGPCLDALRAQATELASSGRITFDGRLSQADARQIGLESDCLIANMHDFPLYDYGVSLNKVFEYLLIARPIIIGANASIEAVKRPGAGIQVAASDVDALADAILRLACTPEAERLAMGRRGRSHALKHYSYDTLAGQLGSGLDRLLLSV